MKKVWDMKGITLCKPGEKGDVFHLKTDDGSVLIRLSTQDIEEETFYLGGKITISLEIDENTRVKTH